MMGIFEVFYCKNKFSALVHTAFVYVNVKFIHQAEGVVGNVVCQLLAAVDKTVQFAGKLKSKEICAVFGWLVFVCFCLFLHF